MQKSIAFIRLNISPTFTFSRSAIDQKLSLIEYSVAVREIWKKRLFASTIYDYLDRDISIDMGTLEVIAVADPSIDTEEDN